MKTFVGNGWKRDFDNGGSVINISVNLDKLAACPQDKYGNVRLVVGERRAVDEKSKSTHTVSVDDYYYSKQGGNTPAPVERRDDLPF